MRAKLSSLFSLYRGLPRSVYVLFIARIVNSMGNFVFPFLALFLTDRLGYSADTAGIIILLSASSSIPGSLAGGKLADRIGRKKVLISGLSLAAFTFIPCALLGDSLLLPYFIVAADFFIGMANPCSQAIVTDLTTSQNRQAAFSLLYLGHNLGFAIGPLIAGFLYNSHTSWIFLGDALTTLASVSLIILFVKESAPSKQAIEASFSHESPERAERGSLVKALLARPYLLGFVFISMFISFVYAQHTFSLPLQVKALFPEQGSALFGGLMTTNALVVILLTAPIIALTKRIKPVLNQALASFLYAFGFGMIYFIQAYPLFIVSTIIWTVGEVISATNVSVYIANHTPISHRGRFNSVLPVLLSSGFTIGPPIMGAFIRRFTVHRVWLLCSAITFCACLALLVLHVREKRKTCENCKHGALSV